MIDTLKVPDYINCIQNGNNAKHNLKTGDTMNTIKGLKSIGKGTFTKCYLNSCGESVTLITCDPIKECIANGWFPESELFPKVEHVDYCERTDRNIYTMEYYPRTKGLKSVLDVDQWKIYQTLCKVYQGLSYHSNIYEGYQKLYKAFESIQDQELREIMIDALDACSNYGSDVGFEISPRNVAVKNGKLILLDVFFMRSTLKQIRSK